MKQGFTSADQNQSFLFRLSRRAKSLSRSKEEYFRMLDLLAFTMEELKHEFNVQNLAFTSLISQLKGEEDGNNKSSPA